jgi:hypothetical protein
LWYVVHTKKNLATLVLSTIRLKNSKKSSYLVTLTRSQDRGPGY